MLHGKVQPKSKKKQSHVTVKNRFFWCVPGYSTLLTVSIKSSGKDLPVLWALRSQSSGSCRTGSVSLIQHQNYLLNSITHVSMVRRQGQGTGVNIA